MVHDPLSDLSMKPSRDELARRQGSGKGATKSARQGRGAAEQGAVRRAGNGPVFLVLALIVAAAATAGWFMWQEVKALSAELTQSKLLLSESQSNLGDLKQNIASQSSTIDQTGDQIRRDLDLHMAEIRKLWDLANKANKPAIAANEKAVSQLKAGIAQQKKAIVAMEEVASRAAQVAVGLESRIQQGELQASVINSQVNGLETELGELVAQNKALKNMLIGQEAAIKRLEADGGKVLKAKLADIEQRLNSIDAFRQQVNTRLTQHDRSIAELYQKP